MPRVLPFARLFTPHLPRAWLQPHSPDGGPAVPPDYVIVDVAKDDATGADNGTSPKSKPPSSVKFNLAASSPKLKPKSSSSLRTRRSLEGLRPGPILSDQCMAGGAVASPGERMQRSTPQGHDEGRMGTSTPVVVVVVRRGAYYFGRGGSALLAMQWLRLMAVVSRVQPMYQGMRHHS